MKAAPSHPRQPGNARIDFRRGPPTAHVLDMTKPEDIDALVRFEEREGEPFPVPQWVRKRVLKRAYDFRNDADRLTLCLGLLYPRDLPPARWEVAYAAEQACSVVDIAPDEETLPAILKRAADAAEDLLRRNYVIPRETVINVRAGRDKSLFGKRKTTDEV